MKSIISNYFLCAFVILSNIGSSSSEKTPYQPFGLKLGPLGDAIELPKTHPQFYKDVSTKNIEGYPYSNRILKGSDFEGITAEALLRQEKELETITVRKESGTFQNALIVPSIRCNVTGPGLYVTALADDAKRIFDIKAYVMLGDLGIVGDGEQNKAFETLLQKMYSSYGAPKVDLSVPNNPVSFSTRYRHKSIALQDARDLINKGSSVHFLFENGDLLIKLHRIAHGDAKGSIIIQMIDGTVGAQFAAKVKEDMGHLLAQRRAEVTAIQEEARKKLGL